VRNEHWSRKRYLKEIAKVALNIDKGATNCFAASRLL